ncbi:MAG: YdcF family protein [Acetobacteraceae bacterium]
MFAAGRARLLLVSGVARGAGLPGLIRRTDLDPAPLAAHITLGHLAKSTLGNAEETATWAREHGIRSLIVVTAGYHMPRALLEMSRTMPDVTFYPAPVQPPGMHQPGDAAIAGG